MSGRSSESFSGSPAGRSSGSPTGRSSDSPSGRPPRRWGAWILAAAGAGLTLLGALSVGTYLYGVFVSLGRPDQSWIFWGLVFLFFGIGALVTGLVLLLWARHLFRRNVAETES